MDGDGTQHARPELTSGRPIRHKDRGLARTVIALVALIIGAGLFLWAPVTAWLGQREVDAALERDLGTAADSGGGAGDGAEVASAKRDKAADPAYQFLLDYNERVAAGEAGAINDPWGIGSDGDELAAAGLADAMVGSLSVPSMGVRLPIYLGASSEHLNEGAALVAGTSAPLGDVGDGVGAGSNCVIAAHRGAVRGVPMFRDIEDVRLGDELAIETPWDTLAYRAVQIEIIAPTDVDAVRLQPGRDLVTLITCHPYGSNAKRYMVVFERVAGAEGGLRVDSASVLARNPVAEALKPTSSPQLALERWLRVAGLAVMAALALALAWKACGRFRRG